MAALDGYKTYILAGLVLVTAVLKGTGVIDAATAETVVMILLGGGLASLRKGVKSDIAKAEERRDA